MYNQYSGANNYTLVQFQKIRTFSVSFKKISKLTAYGNELNFEQCE